jgi:DNA-binding response OmpR family regulator
VELAIVPSAVESESRLLESPPLRAAILDSSAVGRAGLRAVTTHDGWTVHSCSTVAEVVEVAAGGDLDVIVLSYADVPQPEIGLPRLVMAVDAPVVVLAEGQEALKSALLQGAALAVGKPFDPELLLLSIRALLRSVPLAPVLAHIVRLGDLNVHIADHTIQREGRRQVLSATEWLLLAFLMAHPGRVFSRDEVVHGLWGGDLSGRHAEVELYVSRLRKKVERNPRKPVIVETVRHLGYRLGVTPITVRRGAAGPAATTGARAEPGPQLHAGAGSLVATEAFGLMGRSSPDGARRISGLVRLR